MLTNEELDALDAMKNITLMDHGKRLAFISYEDGKALISQAREANRLREENEALNAEYSRLIDGIVVFGYWGVQHHNGAPDCDCGRCRASALLLGYTALTGDKTR